MGLAQIDARPRGVRVDAPQQESMVVGCRLVRLMPPFRLGLMQRDDGPQRPAVPGKYAHDRSVPIPPPVGSTLTCHALQVMNPPEPDAHRCLPRWIAGIAFWTGACAVALAPAHGQGTRPDVATAWPEARAATRFGRVLQDADALPTGLRLDAALTYGKPFLDDRGKSTWERVGTFGAGAGIALGVGYDWSGYGVSVELDAANSGIGGRHASILSLVALAHWYPGASLGGAMATWRPRVTVGYVRQALGGLDVTRGELPPSLAGEADPFLPHLNFVVLGNGARVGAAAERPLRGQFTLQVGATVDVVSSGTATLDGFDTTLRPSGRSIRPRGAIGIVWRPF